jgi:hypothetical protein
MKTAEETFETGATRGEKGEGKANIDSSRMELRLSVPDEAFTSETCETLRIPGTVRNVEMIGSPPWTMFQS